MSSQLHSSNQPNLSTHTTLSHASSTQIHWEIQNQTHSKAKETPISDSQFASSWDVIYHTPNTLIAHRIAHKKRRIVAKHPQIDQNRHPTQSPLMHQAHELTRQFQMKPSQKPKKMPSETANLLPAGMSFIILPIPSLHIELHIKKENCSKASSNRSKPPSHTIASHASST
jgi:hypothetical protein